MEIPDSAVWAAAGSLVVTVIGGVKVVWAWLAKREEAREAARAKIDEDRGKEHATALKVKDDQIAALSEQVGKILASKREILDTREATIKDLSKKLSAKSDESAATVERLMQMSMGKIEEWSDKDRAMLERALSVMADFTATVRRIFGNGSDAGRLTPAPPPAKPDRDDDPPRRRDR
jgi:hypothetical protein